MLVCHNCGRIGHFWRMCRSKEKQSAATDELEASGIVVAATGKAQSQICIWVTVSYTREGRKPARIQVVLDTGAQVCATGLELVATLGIKTTLVKHGGSLRDVTNVNLKPMVSFSCHMQYGDK